MHTEGIRSSLLKSEDTYIISEDTYIIHTEGATDICIPKAYRRMLERNAWN
jgi:hypothetical protein